MAYDASREATGTSYVDAPLPSRMLSIKSSKKLPPADPAFERPSTKPKLCSCASPTATRLASLSWRLIDLRRSAQRLPFFQQRWDPIFFRPLFSFASSHGHFNFYTRKNPNPSSVTEQLHHRSPRKPVDERNASPLSEPRRAVLTHGSPQACIAWFKNNPVVCLRAAKGRR
jgi:hypothetical protein